MPRLLMVGCGWMGRPYLSRAHKRGLRVAVLDSATALSWDETRQAMGPDDKGYAIPHASDEGWLIAASEALRDGPVDGVVAFSEQHVIAAAMLADELGLPGPGLRAALTSRNKLMQRELFARHRLPQPDYLLATPEAPTAGWAASRYPVVAKPLSSMGGLGVRIVADETELRDWRQALDPDSLFLLEQHMSGPEYSVEAIISAGSVVFWNVTAKTTTEPPFCVELEHHVPADIGAEQSSDMQRCLHGVVDALGMNSGIVHLELILLPDGAHIVEVAVRTPGDYIMDVIQAATGVDLFDAVIAVACGLPLATEPVTSDVASVWFPTPDPGTVTAVDGADRLNSLDGVVNAEIDVAPGSTVNPLRSSMDRVGMVIYKAPDRERLRAGLDRIRQELTISTEAHS